MEAIILAGGFGTRLRKVVPHLPKPMAKVAGAPFLEILLLSLSRKGFKRIILSVGYMADSISNYFGFNYEGMDLIYAREEKPLGTGGAVRLALLSCKQDHVFVFNGDTFLDLEVKEVELLWQEFRHPIIIGCQVPHASRYGRLKVKNNYVVGFLEKKIDGAGLINAGCYVLNRNQLDDFSLGRAFSLENDYLTKAIKDNTFNVYITEKKFIDIGIPEDYIKAQTMLAHVFEELQLTIPKNLICD